MLADRTTAELRFLADATATLSSSLSYDETLDHIACLAVPLLADWCVVDLVEASGTVRRASAAHRDPTKTELARSWASEDPSSADPAGAMARVLQTGRPEVVDEVPGAALESLAPRRLEALRALGLRSYLIVPLVARERTLGAVTLVRASSARRYQAGDVALATELARRAAIAVDHAQLYASARAAIRARDRLLAIVSHDLRNPLGAIGTIASLLRKRYLDDPKTREPLELVEQSVERMKRLLSDLLDMSSIESGKLSIVRAPVDAMTLVDDAIAAHAVLAEQRGIALGSDARAVARVCCDRGRIAQVLGNVLGNALKFCRPGDSITVRVGIDGEHARFTVADTGPGIAAEDLPHIFEPFWSAQAHAREGTGLGLSISKGLIEAHGGALRAESEPGRGTRVSFTLPLAGP